MRFTIFPVLRTLCLFFLAKEILLAREANNNNEISKVFRHNNFLSFTDD
jgi:hypothetical protein